MRHTPPIGGPIRLFVIGGLAAGCGPTQLSHKPWCRAGTGLAAS